MPARIERLQQLLRDSGPMTSDELLRHLGWSRAVLASVTREAPRVRSLGVALVPSTVHYVKATIRIADRAQPPQSPRMKTAKRIYAVLEERGALAFADLHAVLGLNRNTTRNTIYKHPELFEVVQSMDERPGRVTRGRYEYVES